MHKFHLTTTTGMGTMKDFVFENDTAGALAVRITRFAELAKMLSVEAKKDVPTHKAVDEMKIRVCSAIRREGLVDAANYLTILFRECELDDTTRTAMVELSNLLDQKREELFEKIVRKYAGK